MLRSARVHSSGSISLGSLAVAVSLSVAAGSSVWSSSTGLSGSLDGTVMRIGRVIWVSTSVRAMFVSGADPSHRVV